MRPKKLSSLGEFAAIERIQGICKRPGRDVTVGIGDDAAAYRVPDGYITLASCDMLIEGVHFDLGSAGYRSLGYKALAVNLSDIAAMGGRPRYYMVAAALGRKADEKDLGELYQGIESAAAPHKVRAIGGDTCGTSGPVVISVTVIGEARPKDIIRRSGARPGDDIYVTGTLGDSAGGLVLLKSGGGRKRISPVPTDGLDADYLISRHLMPTPRVKAGMVLAEAGLATSMIDVSDGLSSDLMHIMEQSGAGALVYAESVPLSGGLKKTFGDKKALRLALHGGEDYELLFTARPGSRAKLQGLKKRAGTSITLIGSVTEGGGAFLVSGDGGRKALRPGGYEHFR